MNLSDIDKTGRVIENKSSEQFQAATVELTTLTTIASVDTFNNNDALKDFFNPVVHGRG